MKLKKDNEPITTSHIIQDGHQREMCRVFSKHDFKAITRENVLTF